jgi:hypothetical protein
LHKAIGSAIILEYQKKDSKWPYGNNMLIARGHVDLNNDAIIAQCYQFITEHELKDFDNIYGKLDGKLSSVVMAMYLKQQNLKHLMPHNWEEFGPLVNAIKNQSNGEDIKTSWFNILPSNTDLKEHNHSGGKTLQGTKYASFVYYPQLTEGAIPIELLIDNQWVPIPAQAGDWICFGLDSLHRVPMNVTNQHRISFAFNV